MITFQNYKLLVSIDNSLGSKGFSELISLCMKKGHKNCSRDKGKRTECDFETFTLSEAQFINILILIAKVLRINFAL